MTDKKTEALKLALEALEYISSHYMSLPKIGCMALAAVEEALAEQPAQQEVDWEKLYRQEVKKKEALAAKYERDTGKKLTRIVPMAEQPAQVDPCIDGSCSCCWTHLDEQPTQQEPVAWDSIEAMAAERYKVVPAHDSMFYRHAVVAGNGTQQLYIGRELECENMARKFAGAFLDGAFVMQSHTSPPAQRKPLTLGQKQRLWSSVGDKPTLKDRVNAYGLAIEAAHGIKEKNT